MKRRKRKGAEKDKGETMEREERKWEVNQWGWGGGEREKSDKKWNGRQKERQREKERKERVK